MKKIGALILAVGLVFGFAGCKTSTEELTLTKIEITNPADKVEYIVGEDLDTTGLEITATYSDESTQVVTGWTTSGYDKTKTGEQTVTVSYTETEVTAQTSYTVTVKEVPVEPEDPGKDPVKVELTKIEITAQPEKKDYFVGATQLDLTGLKVTATYKDGTTANVTDKVTTSGFNSSAAVESQTITVTYNGKTATFTIKIKPDLFNWYETPEQLSAGIPGTYGTKGTYVLFGVWPQDVVPVADVATLGLETSTDKVTRGYMEYVKGSDGNYYVKCAENAYGSGYKYKKDDSDVKQGGTTSRWFKVMPIKWRVVDTAYDVDGSNGSETAKLLVAENILTANVPYYEDYENNRKIDEKTVYPNNYMHSQIRAYLNGLSYMGISEEKTQWNNKGFLQTAFTSEAIDKIITTKVDNAKEQMSYNGTNGMKEEFACGPTDDKIFLLSEKEVVQYSKSGEAYDSYGPGNSRIRVTTDFAKANYAYQSTIDDYGGYYWLRSPYYSHSNFARDVIHYGDANYNRLVYDTIDGVVPALSISF